jgi:hypothetical protein
MIVLEPKAKFDVVMDTGPPFGFWPDPRTGPDELPLLSKVTIVADGAPEAVSVTGCPSVEGLGADVRIRGGGEVKAVYW